MPTQTPLFNAEILQRYDRPGPRYTSYPTAPQFHTRFSEADLREAAIASNGDPIPRQLSVYVHVPFCNSPCFYCGCNRIITRNKSHSEKYLETLRQEVDLVAPLFDHDRELIQLHFGGGTPNFLSPKQLHETVSYLRQNFHFSESPERDLSIELDPRYITPDEISELAAAGFNRASLGVQDFDPIVQAAVNRVQSIEETKSLVDACRAHHFRSVNLDLIYGLPKQTLAGFEKTLDAVLTIRPDRIALYSYAHLPELFKPQRKIESTDLPDAETKLRLLQLSITRLTDAGYVYIGMDHFALPNDSLALARLRGCLHRNFMGYTTHSDSDLIGLGVSAISHIGDSYSQNFRDLPHWQEALDKKHLPVFRGINLSEDDQLRATVIHQLMCNDVVIISTLERRYDINFNHYFAEAIKCLRSLEADGLVQLEPDRIVVTSQGRLLLRNIAMCFDRYLPPPYLPSSLSTNSTHFSRAI